MSPVDVAVTTLEGTGTGSGLYTYVFSTHDFNGDGKSDIAWRDTGGNTSIWFMNGVTVASTAGLGNIAPVWTIQNVNAE